MTHSQAAVDAARQVTPVAGYRQQDPKTLVTVNMIKAGEEQTLRLLDGMQGDASIDQRWLAIARTHIEQGHMALVRALMRPSRLSDELLASMEAAADAYIATNKET